MFIKSKIQFFESKSQPGEVTIVGAEGCLSSQRYNFLKANHNEPFQDHQSLIVVYQVKDTIFWKQITTFHLFLPIQALLFIKSKIQFFESKSQLLICAISSLSSCLSSQRYNFLKANHNCLAKKSFFLMLFIKSKIQFFESKSQLCPLSFAITVSCLSSQRYNFLKANHNEQPVGITTIDVVYQVKDTIFWKQITTTSTITNCNGGLFIKSKIQFFESKSQQNQNASAQSASCLSSQRYNFLKANHNSIPKMLLET